MQFFGQKQQKMYVQAAKKLNPQQREVYDAVVDEINQTVEYKTISGLQALIEILVRRNVLSHGDYFELDDEAISTKQVLKMFVEKYGASREPNGNTVRNHARKYNLGVKIGENFHHSKKKWEEYLKHVCDYKER